LLTVLEASTGWHSVSYSQDTKEGIFDRLHHFKVTLSKSSCNTPHFYCQAYLKKQLYENNPRNTKYMPDSTYFKCYTNIAAGTLICISGNMDERPEVCIYNTEGHFQYILWKIIYVYVL